MHGVLAALVVAEEIDPATVRPSPLGTVAFLFLLGVMILLIWSFLRHMRRVDENLGPARTLPTDPRRGSDAGSAGTSAPLSTSTQPDSDRQAPAGLGDPGAGEGDSR